MSGAILYLAIVAIWAFLLVPGWVRKSHRVFGQVPDEVEIEVEFEADLTIDGDSADELAEDETFGDYPAARRGLLSVARFRRTVTRRTVTRRTVTPHGRAASPPRRARIVRARRRALLTLALLASAAAACTVLKPASWWVCVPPAGMLGGYLLLLREAGRADAEQARWRAEEARRASAASAASAASQRAEAVQGTRGPEPVAEIIDISVRVTDQLYDQYADATVRAVGD